MQRGDTRAGWAGLLAFAFAFPFGVAGSLMIAPWVSLLAVFAFPVHGRFWRPERPPWALFGVGVFLAWALVSFSWSPHDDARQLWRTGLGVPLYILFAVRVGQLDGPWRRRAETALLFGVIALGLFLLSETLFDGAATRGFKLAEENGAVHGEFGVEILVNRSLGHAAVPLLLMSMPAALITWREGGPAIGVGILVLAAIAAFSFDTEVNTVAFVFGLVAAGLTALWPRTMLACLFGLLAGAVIVLPLILPGLIDVMPDSWRAALPASFEWRLQIWSYTGDLIREQPWFGYGLDASRPLNGEAEVFALGSLHNVEALPMHPHNATLHVWLETGAVGAALLAGVLVALGGRIAAAPQLSRLQAIAVAWITVVYVSLIVFSYGVWQEWHQGTLALAATSVFFLAARHRPR
ncbi:O-antigen ligase family protein [Maricaulis maris]|uniref:O-antigen ligase n=1 Tax=Maricaulis maris TaxID=74318 RepID=A0A495D099_9PROT|nr:O-antigen ligase family protein [Maricaulis maris]RKQ94209.1 O-antigen ligase [Maricaulis maris]